MSIKISRKELLMMDAVDVYKLVLSEKIKSFPSGFWSLPEAKCNAKKCTRFLIEEILKWGKVKLVENMSQKVLRDYKLKGMLTTVFDDVTFNVIENAYPG